MKRNGRTVGFLMVLSLIVTASADQGADLGSRESLFQSNDLYPFSVGMDYKDLSRDIQWNGGGETTLEGRNVSAFIGVDIFPWLTLFGTAGLNEAEVDGGGEGSSDPLFSIGSDVNLWQYDLKNPEFIEGRLSLRGGFEAAFADFNDERAGDGNWTELDASLTANYEIYVADIKDLKRVPYSLVLYVGPLLSKLDGEVGSGDAQRDFEESTSLGVGYGVNLFIASNLSTGFHVQSFDGNMSWRSSLRYRF